MDGHPDRPPRVSRSERAVAERVGDDIVVLDPERDRYFRLNAAAALLWEALERPASVEELACVLSARFGVEPQRARTDAGALVRDLSGIGLVEVA